MDEVFFMSFLNETFRRFGQLISGRDLSTPRSPVFEKWRDERNTRNRGIGSGSLRSAYLNGIISKGDLIEVGDKLNLVYYRPVILKDGYIGHIFIDQDGNEQIQSEISTWRKV